MGSANADEELPLGNALYRSTLESSRYRPSSSGYQSNYVSPELALFSLHQSNRLVLLSDPDADTLVVIGAPPRQADQDDNAYAPIAHHFANHHRIHSKNLFNLGSAKFNDLLGPSSQFRTARRLKTQGILPGGKPHGIKYLLDLRPPDEDEEAIYLITELSCSSGILTWFKAQKKYKIPGTMVRGQDDSSLLPNFPDTVRRSPKVPKAWKKKSRASPERRDESLAQKSRLRADSSHSKGLNPESRIGAGSSHSEESAPSRIGNWEGVFPTAPVIPDQAVDDEECAQAADDDGGDDSSQASPHAATNPAPTEDPAKQPEYSQLRHWSAIERLLHAIEGNAPMLDSAPKLWTFYQVAKYFGCASNERISGWITTWLFTAPNHNFIQCNPEVCYRIGLGIQSEALIKDAFSLLVGEKALMNVHRENPQVSKSNPEVSVAGRKLELLDDDELNRIDHAANTFIRRIQLKYDALISQDMLWLERSRAFRVLANFVAHSRHEEEVARQLKQHIKSFVRSRLLWVLTRDYTSDMPEMEQAPESVRPFYHRGSAQFLVYNELSKEERIFSRFFWAALREEKLDQGDNSVFSPRSWESCFPSRPVSSSPGWSRLARKLQNDRPNSKLAMIQKSTLYEWAAKFAKILYGRSTLATAKLVRECWADDPYPNGKFVTTLANEACAMTQSSETIPDDCLPHHKPGEIPALPQIENLQLSSPKCTQAMNPLAGLADEKRGRLGIDDTYGGSDQLNGIKAELPARRAGSQDENNLTPVKEGKTIKVAILQGLEELHPLGARFANVDAEAPVDDKTRASSSKAVAPQSLLGEPSPSRKQNKPKQLEVGGEPSFSIEEVLVELTRVMQRICDEMLLAAHFFRDNEVPPTDLIDSLTSLTDGEWKYLPLWAGGCDDGSGGVFNDIDVPSLETGGFDGGQRGLGFKEKSRIAGSSNWSEILSAVGKASKEATNGTATETATVQSLGDTDMDVRSFDDVSSVRDAETVVSLDYSSVDNLHSDDTDEMGSYDDEDVGGDGVAFDDADTGDIEEGDWDDCDM